MGEAGSQEFAAFAANSCRDYPRKSAQRLFPGVRAPDANPCRASAGNSGWRRGQNGVPTGASAVLGNVFDRRRWRMKGENVGAVVGDWQGVLTPQTEPGTTRGRRKRVCEQAACGAVLALRRPALCLFFAAPKKRQRRKERRLQNRPAEGNCAPATLPPHRTNGAVNVTIAPVLRRCGATCPTKHRVPRPGFSAPFRLMTALPLLAPLRRRLNRTSHIAGAGRRQLS